MKRCMYCKEKIEGKGYDHKIGYFCSEAHFDKYYESLSNEELVQVMNKMCVCSDESDGEQEMSVQVKINTSNDMKIKF